MEDQLIRLLTENGTLILLSVLTTLTSALVMGIRNITKSVEKTSSNVDDVHKLVNGGLTSRLNHMVNRIQDHVDERFNSLDQKLRGLEARLFLVEKTAEHIDHNCDDCHADCKECKRTDEK